jgi:hypothetical protein
MPISVRGPPSRATLPIVDVLHCGFFGNEDNRGVVMSQEGSAFFAFIRWWATVLTRAMKMPMPTTT